VVVVIEIPDPSVVVLIGAAGSGKSTFAMRHFAAEEILSSDALRERITGDAANQRVTGTVFRIIERTLDQRVALGRLTVIDATNLKRTDRRPWLAAARRRDVPAVAIVLALSRDVVQARNAARARIVAADVVDRHLATLAVTGDPEHLRAEGFASVTILTTAEQVDGTAVRRRPGWVSRPRPDPRG
jgi:protein phosphatase